MLIRQKVIIFAFLSEEAAELPLPFEWMLPMVPTNDGVVSPAIAIPANGFLYRVK